MGSKKELLEKWGWQETLSILVGNLRVSHAYLPGKYCVSQLRQVKR
jgi:hypothetical protein